MEPDISAEDVEASKQRTKGRTGGGTTDFLTRLTDSWDIDDELEDLFWAYASKDMVLSNFSKADIEEIMDGFDDTIADYIIQQAEHEFTWEEHMAIGQFRDWLKARLNRSYEGFERKMETTETSISRNVVESPGAEEGGGLGDRLRGFFGRSESPEEKKGEPMEVPR